MKYASKVVVDRVFFDPKDTQHLKIYQSFVTTGKWPGKYNTCPFHLKWPYVDVLAMIKDEIIKQHLKTIIRWN